MEAKIIASYDEPALKTRVTLESAPLYTKIDSSLSLKTTGLFYTSLGDQIGVGSVPPVVGDYTSYWVIIKVTNTNNKINDFKVTAKVPNNIEFTNIYNVTDGDQIKFNEQTRILEWDLASVPAMAGIFNPGPEARIQLSITPTADQLNKSPLILTNITATAKDAVTSAFLSANGANVSTAIFDDPTMNKVIE
ncbi:MAG: hypothetical protein A2Y67_04280 [Candidatus Buchananbacteria bacterium RBG_13_39_9]|uniref:DUF11 domain-containing protein n=1 Tax=Candidatus Buchananbacteria bacterium RBG_13_39_9 TaxID=1797531 RepID=A0A1G1XNJ1_9BACT|nr:MAG: hypothetical protein A2Y67_04280 [Candidatus Buchananbacteria bacterium RBG_13_39_9]